jgi:membrane-associated phospholipid phosphatase
MSFDLTAIDHFLFQGMNGLAGRWWLLDSLVSVSVANDLIKGGVLGACFFAAWYGGQTPEATQRARKTLLVSLITCVFALATTKLISHVVMLPRPYVLSQAVYELREGDLVPYSHLDYRVPLDGRSQTRFASLRGGDIPAGDWGTFPSDHAGFFVVLSLGISLASRRIGLIALVWTFFVILGGKIMTGLHTPLDVAAGAAIAAVWLGMIWAVAQTRLGKPLDWMSQWTARHAALSSAVLFLVVFEISSTLDHVQELLSAVGKHTLGIG